MLDAAQCRDRGVLAADQAAATTFPQARDAWERIAHEWETLATIAAVQHALMNPLSPRGLAKPMPEANG